METEDTSNQNANSGGYDQASGGQYGNINSIDFETPGMAKNNEGSVFSIVYTGPTREDISRSNPVKGSTALEPPQGITFDNKMYIQAKCKGDNTNCLIDTGATVNCMNKQFWDKIKIKEPETEAMKTGAAAQGANGSDLTIYGECLIPLTIGGREIPESFIIMDVRLTLY